MSKLSNAWLTCLSLYKHQVAITKVANEQSRPIAKFSFIVAIKNLGNLAELSEQIRARLSLMFGFEKRSINVSLYSSKSIPSN